MLTTTREPAGASMDHSTAPVKALAFTSKTFTSELRAAQHDAAPGLARRGAVGRQAGQLRGQGAQLGEAGGEVDGRALRHGAARVDHGRVGAVAAAVPGVAPDAAAGQGQVAARHQRVGDVACPAAPSPPRSRSWRCCRRRHLALHVVAAGVVPEQEQVVVIQADRDGRGPRRAGAGIVEVAAAPCARPLRVIRPHQTAGRERQQSGDPGILMENAHTRNTVTRQNDGSTTKTD